MKANALYKDSLYDAYYQAVKKVPTGIALDAPDGHLSFSELNIWSDQVAANLGLSSVGSVVGLFFHPSVAFYVAVVACMKAGVIAKLLDPAVPIKQGETMGMQRCLTSIDLLDRARSLAPQIDCVTLERNSETLAKSSFDITEVPAFKALHRIVTSGSRGSPTTVTISREAIYLHFIEMADAYQYIPGNMNANLARHTSAAGINGFWRLLLTGAGFMCFDLYRTSFDEIYERLKLGQVLTLQGTPTVLDSLAKACENRGILETIKRIILGGEPLTPMLLKKISVLVSPDCALSYNYSSSETMQITVFNAPLASVLDMEKIPCGLPLPSRQVEILGSDDQPVPPGEMGEIVVTAELLAMQISGKNTERRLTQAPDNPKLKVYRTHDLGRWNEHGQLEHLGRIDRQLKIRGVRVNPIQVERELECISGVSNAVVIGISNSWGRQELVACLVRDKTLASENVIEDILSDRLPRPFIPTRFLDFESMPVMPSGKADLKVLEAKCHNLLASERNVDEKQMIQRESPLRSLLRQEWSKVLGRKVPKDAGLFIHEGGDSLKATMLVTALGRMGVKGLSPVWVAEYPTLSAQEEILSAFSSVLLATHSDDSKQTESGVPIQEENKVQQKLDKSTILERLGWV